MTANPLLILNRERRRHTAIFTDGEIERRIVSAVRR
jgi:hypothetical protein